MAYKKMFVIGKLIRETETHYITVTTNGTSMWSKAWYRLSYDN